MAELVVRIIIKDDGTLAIKKFQDEAAKTEKQTTKTKKSVDELSGSFIGLKSAITALGVGFATKEFIKTADTMNLLEARVKLVTKATDDYKVAQSQLLKIANENRVNVESVTKLYTKLADPIRQMGGTMQTTLNITNAFSKALLVGGANTEEAASATLQFAQAMGSGVLRGDEFNSIAEASPRILKAVADSLGVAQGKLRDMAADGKLTAGIVGGALLESMTQLEAEAAKMPLTVGGAFQILKNNLAVSIQEFDKATGASTTLANSIMGLSQSLTSTTSELIKATESTSQWTKENQAGINTVRGLTGEIIEFGAKLTAIVGAGILNNLSNSVKIFGEIGKAIGYVNEQGKTAAQVADEQAKAKEQQAKYTQAILDLDQKINAPAMSKIEKEKIEILKKQAEARKDLLEIKKKEGWTTEQLSVYEAKLIKLQEKQNKEAKQLKSQKPTDKKAEEEAKKAYEAFLRYKEDADKAYTTNKTTSELITEFNKYEQMLRSHKFTKNQLSKLDKIYTDKQNAIAEQAIKEQNEKVMQANMQVNQAIFDLTATEQDKAIAKIGEQAKAWLDLGADINQVNEYASKAIQDVQDKSSNAYKAMESIAGSLENAFVGAFESIIKGGKDLGNIMNNLLNNIASELFRIYVVKNLVSGITSGISGYLGIPAPQQKYTGGMVGYASGGYTGDGGKYEPKGVVHGGEYVIPKWQVQKMPDTVSALENIRKRGYANGGIVSDTSKGGSVEVRIINESSGKVEVKKATQTFDFGKQVINVWLQEARTNASVIETIRGMR